MFNHLSAEIVFVGNIQFEIIILAAILCFANLNVEVTKYGMLTDRFELTTHTILILEKQVGKKIYTKMASKNHACFRFQSMLNTHIFSKGFNILSGKKIFDIYKLKKTLIFKHTQKI